MNTKKWPLFMCGKNPEHVIMEGRKSCSVCGSSHSSIYRFCAECCSYHYFSSTNFDSRNKIWKKHPHPKGIWTEIKKLKRVENFIPPEEIEKKEHIRNDFKFVSVYLRGNAKTGRIFCEFVDREKWRNERNEFAVFDPMNEHFVNFRNERIELDETFKKTETFEKAKRYALQCYKDLMKKDQEISDKIGELDATLMDFHLSFNKKVDYDHRIVEEGDWGLMNGWEFLRNWRFMKLNQKYNVLKRIGVIYLCLMQNEKGEEFIYIGKADGGVIERWGGWRFGHIRDAVSSKKRVQKCDQKLRDVGAKKCLLFVVGDSRIEEKNRRSEGWWINEFKSNQKENPFGLNVRNEPITKYYPFS